MPWNEMPLLGKLFLGSSAVAAGYVLVAGVTLLVNHLCKPRRTK